MTDDPIRTSAEAMEAAVLPDARIAGGTGGAPCVETAPLPAALTRKSAGDKSPAEWAWQRLVLFVQKFEEGLDADEEVGVAFAGSEAGTLRISGIGYFAPDLITFYGRDGDGRKTQLVQHVSQLDVALRAMPREADAPAERIGFRLRREMEGEEGNG